MTASEFMGAAPEDMRSKAIGRVMATLKQILVK